MKKLSLAILLAVFATGCTTMESNMGSSDEMMKQDKMITSADSMKMDNMKHDEMKKDSMMTDNMQDESMKNDTMMMEPM